TLTLRLDYLAELLGGQLGLVGPILFPLLLVGIGRGLTMTGGVRPALRFFSLTAAPLGLFVLCVALTKRVYANWPLPLYIGALLALIEFHADGSAKRGRRMLRTGLALSLATTVLAHLGFLGATFGLPGSMLPTKKLVGWSVLGQTVGSLLQQEEAPFLLTEKYMTASALAFYVESHPRVLLGNFTNRRMTQHDIWTSAEDWQSLRGKTALVVFSDPALFENARPLFASLTLAVPEPLAVTLNGDTIRTFYFAWGTAFEGHQPSGPSGY
ncbi:MAG: hypothetical protein KDD69_08540, partial [Bdellovibrionales bacterium]|nr:hypothetical protein [Bdellovibrionales bacterium]